MDDIENFLLHTNIVCSISCNFEMKILDQLINQTEIIEKLKEGCLKVDLSMSISINLSDLFSGCTENE